MVTVLALDMVGVVLDEERIVSTTLYEMLPSPKMVDRQALKARYDDGLRLGRIGPKEFWEGITDDWETFEKKFIEQLRLVPGIRAAVKDYARQYKIAVISDLPARWASIALEAAGISSFVSIAAFADQHDGARKKDGRLFKALRAEAGVPFEQCFVVDDTLANVRAAEALHMPAAWFYREGREGDGASVTTVKTFEELDKLLAR